MKGITLCAECAYYSMKKHRCTRGASVETDPKAPFYDDCPLTEAAPVVHGRWVSMGPFQGHKCGVCNDYFTDDANNLYYCPRCAAKMVEIEILDYRRNGLPIGAPYPKTICEHGRTVHDGNTL